jgi:UDP-N-acetylmuramate-alanine ligase
MKLPRDVGPIHFIGIGGIGMSGIAEVMATLGYKVQGPTSPTTTTWPVCASTASRRDRP